MKEKVIKTKLIGREDLFKTFMVGELSKLPVLVIGEKGTAKTQAFLDYVNGNNANGKVFIRQLNYDTRAEDLLGYISIPALKEGRVERLNGIQDAEYILLDEVDKAPSSVRNLFLSVLRERAIFDGEKLVPCQWKLIVGTSNREIDDFEQEDIPFLDRFIIKHRIERLGMPNIHNLLCSNEEREIVIKVNPYKKEDFEDALYVIEILLYNGLYQIMSDRSVANIPVLLDGFLKLEEKKENALMKTMVSLVGEKHLIPFMDQINIIEEISYARLLLKQMENAKDSATRKVVKQKILEYYEDLKRNPDIDRKTLLEIKNLLDRHLQN
ncbi:MAG: AAA family ATPase [Thermoanaerobaculia bacterium]